jgi:hypothetical protein
MFVGKARSLPYNGHAKGASLRSAPALPANISLGWQNLPGTNAQAYYENVLLMAVKSFITLAPGGLNSNMYLFVYFFSASVLDICGSLRHLFHCIGV